MLSNTIIRIGVVMDILHGSVFRQVVGALPAITFAIFLAGCSAADDGSSETASASADAGSGGTSGGSTDGGTSGGGGALGASDGVPDINSFTLGPETLNPEIGNEFGVSVSISVQLGDNLNSFVTDGTVVRFMTEYGTIGDGCETVDSSCSVNWLSGAPWGYRYTEANTAAIGFTDCLNQAGVATGLRQIEVPCPYDSNTIKSTDVVAGNFGGLGQVYANRVTIMAWIENGAESFDDENGDGLFNKGETFEDVGEPFIDHNMDRVYGAINRFGEPAEGASTVGGLCPGTSGAVCFQYGGEHESFADLNRNGIYEPEGDGIYNGPLCDIEGEGCTKVGTTIFQQMTLLQAGKSPRIGVIELNASRYNSLSYADISLPPIGDSKTFEVFVSDQWNGYMPEGTTIDFETTYGQIEGEGCKVEETNAYGFTRCEVTIKGEADAGTGVFTIKVKTPNEDIVSDTYTVSKI